MREIERNGIAVAGSVLVDKINEIKAYPQSGELTQIVGLEKAVGGCVPNVALDLKKICPDMMVKAIGKIGNDEEGVYVSEVLSQGGVDDDLAVNKTYVKSRNRAVPRNVRDRKGDGCADHSNDLRLAIVVHSHNGEGKSYVVTEILREKGTNGTVDNARG